MFITPKNGEMPVSKRTEINVGQRWVKLSPGLFH
jgi:hypothetical protein